MAAEKDLKTLLLSMEPILDDNEYVFVTFKKESLADILYLSPLSSFYEKEGLSLIITKESAIKNNIAFESTFRLISLTIHSSLDAVGLTAAISQVLALKGISANVVAAYYHDHIFVPEEKANEAMAALRELQEEIMEG